MSEHLDQSSVDRHNRQELAYELRAVVHHFGELEGGHYTATCFNESEGKWLDFDDSRVREVDTSRGVEKAIVKSSAYVLFY